METELRGQLAHLRQNKGWVVSRERVISWILTDGNMKTAILILDILTDFSGEKKKAVFLIVCACNSLQSFDLSTEFFQNKVKNNFRLR